MVTDPPRSPDGAGAPDARTVIVQDIAGAQPLAPQPEAATPAPDGTVIAAPAEGTVLAADHPPAPPPAPRIVEPGTRINNNYSIESLVSIGGMGEVYRAVNIFTGDPVAVKCILPAFAQDSAMLELFRSEARVLVQLRDEAVVRYHNFVLDQGLDRYCLIMEFVEGPHLGTRLGEGGALREDEAAQLMRRLAAGLARVHDRGVIHRDLSPDNVILRHGEIAEAVMIDFGIARRTEADDGLGGRFAGKLRYVAPEQLGHFGGVVGPQTDIYGLGLLIAAMLRGAPLEMGGSIEAASEARRHIPDLGGISHRMFPLLQYMLEPRPQDRPADMGQVVGILDDPTRLQVRYRMPLWGPAAVPDQPAPAAGALSDSPFGGAPMAPVAAPAAPPAPAIRPPARRGLWSGLAALALAAAGAGAWLAASRGPETPPPPETQTAPPVPEAPALPPRDTATREGFIADQPLPACTYAARIDQGPEAGLIEVIAPSAPDMAPLLDGYQAAFGTRPQVVHRGAAAPQCPALQFAHDLAGRGAAAPLVTARMVTAANGLAIEGTVQGIDGRSAWLFLVAPDGRVYDLTSRAQPADRGALRFGFTIEGAAPGTAAAPYLLGALASARPLASVGAAPAAARSEVLLPAVLAEVRAGSGPAAAGLAVLAGE